MTSVAAVFRSVSVLAASKRAQPSLGLSLSRSSLKKSCDTTHAVRTGLLEAAASRSSTKLSSFSATQPLRRRCLSSQPAVQVQTPNVAAAAASSIAAQLAQAQTEPQQLPLSAADFDFGKRITILFGSQTGTGKSFAHLLGKMAKKKGYEATVADLASYKASSLPFDGLVVFVVACFGHGEPTTNAKTFYDWLMNPELQEPWLKNVKYTIFGLGQSKQHPENYQSVGRAMDARLEGFGAKCFLERGEGDDSFDIESDFDKWSDKFFSQLEALHNGTFVPPARKSVAAAAAAAVSTSASDTSSSIGICAPSAKSCASLEPDDAALYDQAVHFSEVTEIKELYAPNAPRRAQHIEFSIQEHKEMFYKPGDWVGVVPENNFSLVQALCARLGFSLSQLVDLADYPMLLESARTYHTETFDVPPLKTNSSPDTPLAPFNTKFDLGCVLSRLCDITAPPRRTVLKYLAEFAEGAERDKLLFLSSSSTLASADYNSWVVGQRLTLLEILHYFPSIRTGKVPLSLLEHLSPLQPRFYSVSCSPLNFPRSVHVTAATVRYSSPAGFLHEGVCTSYFNRQRVGDRVPIFIKPSQFRLPADPTTPIIMIGAGTGFAPFRGFIQHRFATRRLDAAGVRNLLFFGCNRGDQDLLYANEVSEFVDRFNGGLSVQNAFAFENPWRVFVQHRMIEPENAKLIWKLLSESAYIYICGDSRTVAPGALEAFTNIVEKEGKMSRTDAEAYIKKVHSERRYLLDVF